MAQVRVAALVVEDQIKTIIPDYCFVALSLTDLIHTFRLSNVAMITNSLHLYKILIGPLLYLVNVMTYNGAQGMWSQWFQ